MTGDYLELTAPRLREMQQWAEDNPPEAGIVSIQRDPHGRFALRRGTCGTCKWLRHVGAREDDTEPACGHESEAHPLHWCLPVGNPETFGCTYHEPTETPR